MRQRRAIPRWGQGLSLTLRDVRVLLDELRRTMIGMRRGTPARPSTIAFTAHTVEDWLTRFFFELGPEAGARRGRAFPLIAQDRRAYRMALFSGPDQPIDDALRQRLFGEL